MTCSTSEGCTLYGFYGIDNKLKLKLKSLGRYISDFKQIKQRVPQSSVVDPTLFLLYINSVPIKIHKADTVLFANDINTKIKVANQDRLK
jgi:hypothetical protein